MNIRLVGVAFFLIAFFCVDQTEAQFLGALTTGVDTVLKAAGILGKLIPSSLALPLALAAPVKLSLPFLLGLKVLGLIKLKLLAPKLLIAGPLFAAKAAALGKAGAITAPIIGVKVAAAKKGIAAVGAGFGLIKKAKLALLSLPGKIAAGTVGAVAGAKAGAKAGVVSYKAHSKKKLLAPIFIPAAALLGPSGSSLLPALLPGLGGSDGFRTLTQDNLARILSAGSISDLSTSSASSDFSGQFNSPTFSSAPAFTGANQPTLDGVSTQINLPQLLSGGLVSRRRRDVNDDQPEVTVEALKEIFEYIRANDKERCVPRVICELAVEPMLAGNQGEEVTNLMMNLDSSDRSAPWILYQEAARVGRTTKSRNECYNRYRSCSQSTQALLQVAANRLAGKTDQ